MFSTILFIYLFHSTSCFYLYFKITNHDDQFHDTTVFLGVESSCGESIAFLWTTFGATNSIGKKIIDEVKKNQVV
jgi:hypothetical protein